MLFRSDPVLYRKIQDLKAAWNQGSLHLRSLQDSANEAVRAAIRSRDPHEKEAYTQEAERIKAEYTTEAKRVNAIVDTLNKDKTLARKLMIEASPDISPQSVETGTALPLKCPNIEVSNLDERTGNAETKLYTANNCR